ncbi:hypothetical protein L209DRAFT_752460 [Thermothelomyces heterothallicus CBS 203.75]
MPASGGQLFCCVLVAGRRSVFDWCLTRVAVASRFHQVSENYPGACPSCLIGRSSLLAPLLADASIKGSRGCCYGQTLTVLCSTK